MVAAHTKWTVLKHGPIEKLEPNLWRIQGSLPGMPLKRVMTVARLSDGRLVIHNAMALGDDEMARLESWGEPSLLLVPSSYHRLDAPAYKERYPELKVYCPAGATKRVGKVIPVDGSYGEFPTDADVRVEHLEGTREAEGVLLVRSESSETIVLNDAVFNMPHTGGSHGFIMRHITQSSGGPRISRVARWFIIKKPSAVKRHLQRLADLPDLKRIIVSHHEMITRDPAATLRLVAEAL